MASAGAKRSIFNKPSWASSTTSTDKPTQGEIFGNRVYEGILEAERKRKEKEAQKLKKHTEKVVSRETKRRRISDENEDEDWDKAAIRDGEDDRQDDHDRDHRVARNTPVNNTSFKTGQLGSPIRHGRTQPKSEKTTVNDLEDNEEAEDALCKTPTLRTAKKTTPKKDKPKSQYLDPFSDEDEEDDEYTRELKQKARQKARLQRLGIDVAKPTHSRHPKVGDGKSPSLPPGSLFDNVQTFAPASVLTVEDPLVRLCISTTIPDTKPLLVNRKASQSLGKVREFWCTRQGFDATKTAKVFLTFRGTKLFNASTVRPILEQLIAERPMEAFTIEGGEAESPAGGIELEAMTEEIFQEFHRARDRKALAAAAPGDEDANDFASTSDVQNGPLKPKQDGIVIQLVCQDIATPMQLRVRPSTLISKIMQGFQVTNKIDAAKTCWLVWDGERLEPDTTVEDVGLEHDDRVEVHVR